MTRSPMPSAYSAPMPAPPNAVNGWGRWVAGAIAQIDARMSNHERHSELTTEHIMDLRERVRSLEDRRPEPTPKEPSNPAPSLSDRVKTLKDLGTALVTGLMWLLTAAMAIAHALGWPVAEKIKSVLGAIGSG